MIGVSLKHYRLTASLGAGGMGEVYRATDTLLGREVAIKVLSETFSRDAQSLARFEREAKALATLNHPHIAAIYGFDTDNATRFLVLELIEGETLAERLRAGALPLPEALRIARQLAEAIQAAHEKGIVHRDLKPANVKITPQGRLKVLDFGLAKIQPDALPGAEASAPLTERSDTVPGLEEITAPGMILGTLPYMSPEQARGLETDRRTDIWAFGCCLFESLSGRKPFTGTNASDLIAEILKSDPDWSVLPETPQTVLTLLRGCLEKDPARRLSNIGDIGILLEESTRASVPLSAPAQASLDPSIRITRQHSIAVLPFINIGAEKENEYFSDGITEDLITALSHVDGLRVSARTSSFAFKEKREDIRRIGRELSVKMILEGTVRRSGNRLRITSQLVDVADGFHLWSERFDREVKDVFEIQDEITNRVVGALKIKLGLTEKERIPRKQTANVEAYDLYLLGRHLWARRQPQDLPKVLELFEGALRKDPGYAQAVAGLADYYFYQAYFFGNLPYAETIAKAQQYARKAVLLDENLGEARVSLGFSILADWNFRGALSEFQRAVELSPQYPTALHVRAGLSWTLEGRLGDALAALQRAGEVDPLSVPVRNMRALILSQAGRHQEVIHETHRMLEIDPHNIWEYIGRAYEETGQPEEAIRWYLRWLEKDGANPEAIARIHHACEADGLAGYHRQLSELLLEQPKLLRVAAHWQQAYVIQACARLGKIDEAFCLLEQAYAWKSPLLIWFKTDLRLELLRNDPRFSELSRRIGHS